MESKITTNLRQNRDNVQMWPTFSAQLLCKIKTTLIDVIPVPHLLTRRPRPVAVCSSGFQDRLHFRLNKVLLWAFSN